MDHRKLEITFFFLVLAGVLALSFFIFKPFIYPLVLAAALAIIFAPFYHKARAWLKRDSAAALFTITVVFITVLVPLVLISTQIFKEAGDLYSYISGSAGQNSFLRAIESGINGLLNSMFGAGVKPISLSFDLDSYIKSGASWVLQNLGSLLSSITTITLDIFLFLFAFYYFLRDGSKFKQNLIDLSPLPEKYDKEIAEKVERAITSIVKGSLTVGILQGILTGFGFSIFGIPNPAFWGAVTVFAAFVPGFGTSLVIVPGVIYLFAIGHIAPAIGLLAWGALAVGLVDNFIGPKLVQHGTKIHSFFILIFALGGLHLFGPIGFLLGPIILSLLSALIDSYELISKQGGFN